MARSEIVYWMSASSITRKRHSCNGELNADKKKIKNENHDKVQKRVDDVRNVRNIARDERRRDGEGRQLEDELWNIVSSG